MRFTSVFLFRGFYLLVASGLGCIIMGRRQHIVPFHPPEQAQSVTTCALDKICRFSNTYPSLRSDREKADTRRNDGPAVRCAMYDLVILVSIA